MHRRKLRQLKTDKRAVAVLMRLKKTVPTGTASLTGRIRSPHRGHDGTGPCVYTGMKTLKMYFDQNIFATKGPNTNGR